MPLLLLLPLLLGIVAVLVVIAGARWFANANPAVLANTLRSGGSMAMVLAGVFLIARGQVFLGFPLIMAGLGRLRGGNPFGGGPFGRARKPRPGNASVVRTARLEAILDHDTGDMDGEVLAGRHEGQRFSDLSDEALFEVYADCADCSESRLILEAYLDRRRPDWREDVEPDGNGGARGSGEASGPMTVEEAYDILGLAPGASEAEIRASHRRLMKQMHPDQGGSTFFAAKLNEAKETLLGRRGRQ
ncbi:MAG: DnaJ domain-containing protein [Pseudomonadota bacterium]